MQKSVTSIFLLSVLSMACTDSGVEPRGLGTGSGTLPATGGGLCLVEGEPPRSGGVVKDGIPALTDPRMVLPNDPRASYVQDTERIIGVRHAGEWLAFPLNVMRYHEIVNLSGGDGPLALSYCPLTGTGLAFDRQAVGGAEFGVSGLLWRSNLVMYDRSTNESLWPQMRSRADCGPEAGTILPQIPVSDMTWEAWKQLHPETLVVSQETGWSRNYEANPYEDYERIDAPPFSDIKADPRRQPKERVLGIPTNLGGFAIPFGVFPSTSKKVLNLLIPGGGAASEGTEVVVLWDGASQTAEAFYATPDWAQNPTPGAEDLAFQVVDDGFVDSLTRSTWAVDGRAVNGPAIGSSLREVRGSMVAFWFAWAAFFPDTDLFSASSP